MNDDLLKGSWSINYQKSHTSEYEELYINENYIHIFKDHGLSSHISYNLKDDYINYLVNGKITNSVKFCLDSETNELIIFDKTLSIWAVYHKIDIGITTEAYIKNNLIESYWKSYFERKDISINQ